MLIYYLFLILWGVWFLGIGRGCFCFFYVKLESFRKFVVNLVDGIGVSSWV